MGTKLSLAPEPPAVRAMATGHADPRTDWHAYIVPVLPARAQPAARNGVPWRSWHWLETRRADQRRAEEVFAMVCDAKARAAGQGTAPGPACAADGDHLSIDMAMDARRGVA